MKLSFYLFIFASFCHYMTLQPLYPIWYLSFAAMGVCYASLTLINLFAIIGEGLTHLTELNASVTNYERRQQDTRAKADRGGTEP